MLEAEESSRGGIGYIREGEARRRSALTETDVTHTPPLNWLLLQSDTDSLGSRLFLSIALTLGKLGQSQRPGRATHVSPRARLNLQMILLPLASF